MSTRIPLMSINAIAIVLVSALGACTPRTPASPTPVPTHSAIPTVTETVTPSRTPTRAADDIDARLTRIAATVHPQLTETLASTQATADAIAAVTASAPPPTATLPASTPRQIFTSRQIRYPAWSLDTAWIVFWIPPTNPIDPQAPIPGYLPTFYNAETGQICTHRDFVDTIPLGYFYWVAEGRIVMTSKGESFIGEPCGTFEITPPEYAFHPDFWEISPDGRYRAEMSQESSSIIMNIKDVRTGALLNEVEWSPSHGPEGISFEWVGSHHLLIERSADRGPLLVEVGSSQVTEVLADLFDLDVPPVLPRDITAYGHDVAGTDHFHLLLDLPDAGFTHHTLMLYHSESGAVETLPFQDMAWMQFANQMIPAFTPDGLWLLLDRTSSYDEHTVWIRPIEGSEADTRRLGRIFFIMPAPSGDRVAYVEYRDEHFPSPGVIVASLPAFEVQSHWLAEGYVLNPVGWSPDGTKLLVHGTIPNAAPENSHEALFLIEP